MNDRPSLKLQFQKTLDPMIKNHRFGVSGISTAIALAHRLDTLIQEVYKQSRRSTKKKIALVALGGYGRHELCFASDTDIMFLVKNETNKRSATAVVKGLLHTLLDCGLQIGHSVRSIDECIELAETDFESRVSLLEARLLCGNKSVFASFQRAFQKRGGKDQRKNLVQQMLTNIDLRHQKYGTSTKLLEPNIKQSSGGLRDLHSVFWLLRGTGTLIPPNHVSNSPAIVSCLESAKLKAIADPLVLKEARAAFDFLLRTRNEMHLQARGLHDTLEFTSQRKVAEAIRYKNVEQFMQQYYVAARAVARVAERTRGWASEKFLAPSRRASPQRLTRRFQLRNDALELINRNAPLSSKDVLDACLLCVEHGARFSTALEDRLLRRAKNLRPLKIAQEVVRFRQLLQSSKPVSPVLQRVNDLGILGRWIPEWQRMVAFFQHNIYHYYTADEHTLMVIANAEALLQSESAVGSVFRSLPRRDTLYFACLLHDIAKPLRASDHEIEGVKIAKTILRRLGANDVLDDVLFLIRNHLLMEQVAFRRNLSDPQTILDFASNFVHPTQLDYLYVLTYADLSAVNKNVWTDWKGMLLAELYRKTHEVLTGELSSDQLHAAVHRQREETKESLVSTLADVVSPDDARLHLDAVESPAYLSAFSADEIAQHIRTVRQHGPATTFFAHRNEFTEVTIIAPDAPFALSKFCGVLTANDATILDANIFTRNDGVIIDKFRVVDYISKSALRERQCEKIRQEWNDVLHGVADIDNLLEQHRMKWKRRTAHMNPNIRVDVLFEDHPRYTIIDIFAFDTLGFLYKITGKLSQLGLNIAFAKIATRADGIVDSFYVTDMTGNRIDARERREYVRAQLLSVVTQLADSELVIL
jgi:[protein-PII] uridylyltransferase